MRWIKKFEGYLDRFYYKNPEATDQIKDNEPIDMSRSTYDRLMKIYGSRLGEKDRMDYGSYPSFVDDDDEKYFYGVDASIERVDLNQSYYFLINALSDDWFTLELFTYQKNRIEDPRKHLLTPAMYLPDSSGFWACDGFEGLVKLIDDLGIFRKV